MSVMAATAFPSPTSAFLKGKHRLLIDGKWVDAKSGKTFESRNPATGEILAHVAEGDAADIDLAVAAARRAFNGPWSKIKPFERQQILLKLADLVEANFDELSTLDTLDMGAPLQPHAGQSPARPRHAALVRRHGDLDPWRDHRELAARRDLLLHAEGADRRRRRDHPVERPARRLGLEDRPGARHRLHRRAEAGRGSAADLAPPRRAGDGSRRAARRRQHRAGLWRDGGRRARPRIPMSTRSPSPART